MTEELAEIVGTSDGHKCIKVLSKCSNSLFNSINDILDFTKLEAGRLSLDFIPFNLHEVINRVIDKTEIYSKSLKKSIETKCTVDPKVPVRVVGDPFRLKQVLSNLLSNAVKFSNKTGEVELLCHLETQPKPQDKDSSKMENSTRLSSLIPSAFQFFSSEARDEDNDSLVSKAEQLNTGSFDGSLSVRFEIKDKGIGISQETMKRLFKPFTQADASTTRNYGGTGLARN